MSEKPAQAMKNTEKRNSQMPISYQLAKVTNKAETALQLLIYLQNKNAVSGNRYRKGT